MADREQQDALLELLNSTPVVNGVVQDQLADPEAAKSWQRIHAGSGTVEELSSLAEARDALQDVVRGKRSATSLASLLEGGVIARPHVSPAGVSWEVDVPCGTPVGGGGGHGVERGTADDARPTSAVCQRSADGSSSTGARPTGHAGVPWLSAATA